MAMKKSAKPSKKAVPSIDIDLKQSEKAHLMCRDFSHSWDWMTDLVPHRESGSSKVTYVTRILICLRCGTMRHDEYMVPSFTRVKSSYTYAANYLLPGHKGHIPVSVVRQEVFRRFRNGSWKA